RLGGTSWHLLTTIAGLVQSGYVPSLLVSPYHCRGRRVERRSMGFSRTRMRRPPNLFSISSLDMSVRPTVARVSFHQTTSHFQRRRFAASEGSTNHFGLQKIGNCVGAGVGRGLPL